MKTLLNPRYVLTSCLVLLLAPVSSHASLGDSLDAPGLSWSANSSPSGLAAWFDQSTTTHDGSDAAQSGQITDSQSNWIETTVVGPGKLFFWWKVSCEEPDGEDLYDYLSFSTNGVQAVPSIAGDTDWSWHYLDIAPGSQTLRWSYNKDGSVSDGLDRGWVDQVGFFAGEVPPIITTNLSSELTVAVGGSAQIGISILGSAPLSYQWRRNGANLNSGGHIGGAETKTLTLSPVLSGDVGTYTVVITNIQGSVTSAPAVLHTLDQALDTTAVLWTMSGDANWLWQTGVTHDGIDAAQTGPIDDSQETRIQATFSGAGALSFWWKVSSEIGSPLGDRLQLFSNGVPVLTISGEVDWHQEVLPLAEGSHTFEWRYSKDSSLSSGQDRGWLDQVQFGPPLPELFHLSANGFTGGSFHLLLQGEANRAYRLYSSSNLFDWVPVQTNSDPAGLVPFSDPNAGSQSRRYYRAETDSN